MEYTHPRFEPKRPRASDEPVDPWEKSQTWSACDTVTQPVGGLSSPSKSLCRSAWRQADGWPILKFHCLDLAHTHARTHARTHTHTRALSYLQLRIIKTDFHAADLGSLAFVLHMREKIFKAPCVLLSLFTSLNLCCGQFGTPITDDKHNIPSDYEIPLHYIPKEVAGACWVVLNVYPLEQSLRNLANMFGADSSNKENILVFIAMLKSLRFTFDHQELETAMQVFQCHYQEGSLKNELYFNYIEDILHVAGQETSKFSCKPPSCLSTANAPGDHMEGRDYVWWKRTPLLLVFIPVTACVVLIIWRVTSTRHLPEHAAEDIEMAPCDTVPSVTVSIPLQRAAHAHESR
ncbi:uncharacterized protein LOC133472257 isoform X2 [Phyllopteryx taeniolatus]|uniref:uncharacterized protein LOC133472257 isoform X2 n=1 Tax=Phyllopteryx taeniolatus TaxID=161469 RepID=UPI002AD5AEAF|nr:uncharacterized protein LOC133472257 isoform X2 [Phyllopteryx taeniolatus]